jgi:Lrp/AsnC family transcriptional regulator, leucine-responsive regulatory protein
MTTLDEKDREILECMQRNGRATYAEIGAAVGLAASSVHERVRKLEARGIITGYGPRIDHAQLGLKLTAFVSLVTNVSCSILAPMIRDWPEVVEYHTVAGDECAVLKVRTADPEGLQSLLERLRDIPGVERTRSTVVLRTRWEEGDQPLPVALQEAG